jgi:HSP20 family protein
MLLRGRPYSRVRSHWREMERLQREMNRLFTNASTSLDDACAPSYPAMNVWTSQDEAIITAELPDVNPKDIDISVTGDTLTVSGTRQADELPEDAVYHRRERGCGKFTRAFQLPFPVESGKVEAAFDSGVLQISLPRLEADKPRKIAVKAV